MRNLNVLTLAFVCLVSMVATSANAQMFTRKKQYNTVGISLNAMNYFGDIVPEQNIFSTRFRSTRPNVGVYIERKLHPRISARGSFAWGRIEAWDNKAATTDMGDVDHYRHIRNLNFRNDIKELSGVAMFDLFENRKNFVGRTGLNPYGFVGVAVFHHNPQGFYDGNFPGIESGRWYDLQPLGTEGQNVVGQGYPKPYNRIQIAIPYGIGVRYKLDKNFDLGFEIGMRKTFTDYLDDVSGFYADKSDLINAPGSGELAAVLSDRSADVKGMPVSVMADPNAPGFANVPGYGTKNQVRGDRTDDDWYIVSGFRVSYILSPRRGAPKFR